MKKDRDGNPRNALCCSECTPQRLFDDNTYGETMLNELADVLRAKLGRDQCRDEVIEGQRGNIHEDGGGYSLSVMFKTKAGLNGALKKLCFCEVRQRGDTEAVVYLGRLPDKTEAWRIRRVLKIRKRPELTDEQRKMKSEMVKKLINSTINDRKQGSESVENVSNSNKSM